MKEEIVTERLTMKMLTMADAAFMRVLVNTEGWKRFIGERNVQTMEDAIQYTGKIVQNPDTRYRVVRLRDNNERIGVVTLIKRHYLEHHDIGFAFLPEYSGKGYAYESSAALMAAVRGLPFHTVLLATTMKENERSIALLTKLGFAFEQEMQIDSMGLLVYKKTAVKKKARR